jgi:hypothetical protein
LDKLRTIGFFDPTSLYNLYNTTLALEGLFFKGGGFNLKRKEKKRKEKIMPVFSYKHDCEPVSRILITGSMMQYVVLCLR